MVNLLLKVIVVVFVLRFKVLKLFVVLEMFVEEYEGVIEIVSYTFNELYIKFDYGDV